MLANAYFLAKFRFDTAKNEPAKNFQKFANFASQTNYCQRLRRAHVGRRRAAAGRAGRGLRREGELAARDDGHL